MLSKAKEQLKGLGLKENEASIYLACLQKPMGLFVHEITNMTGIKRSTVDLILIRLQKQSFVSRHKQGARWIYCAESPDKISFSVQEKVNDFNNLIPVLLSITDHGSVPSVRFYEGVTGVERIFDDVLLNSKRLIQKDHELLIMSSGKDLIELFPNHYKKFVQKRIRSGVQARVLAPDGSVSQRLYKTSKPQLRKTCFFDAKLYPFKTEIDIYGDKVALINFAEPDIMGTVIESRAIASSMRSVFDMLWASQVTLP